MACECIIEIGERGKNVTQTMEIKKRFFFPFKDDQHLHASPTFVTTASPPTTIIFHPHKSFLA